MGFSAQQEQCIHARGGPLLISAAAGSGKTTVLIEHILSLLCDEQRPVEIDRLLVVTFTRAAAAELRERLQTRLAARIAEGGENAAFLRRQQLMLPRANICTVDALCQKLLTEYHYRLEGVAAHMNLSQEQSDALLSEALDEVIDRAFADIPEPTQALATALRHSHKNKALHQTVHQLYDFLDNCADPSGWLQQQDTLCSADDRHRQWLQQTALRLQARMACLHRACDQTVAAALRAAADILLVVPCDAKQRRKQQSELSRTESYIEEQRQLLEKLTHFDLSQPEETIGAVQTLTADLSKWQNPTLAQPAHAALLRAKRDRVKELLGQLRALCVLPDREDAAVQAHLHLLRQLVTQLRQTVRERKLARRVTTFADVTALVLQLLTRRDPNGTLVASDIAVQLSQHFVQVLVDEYQDISEQQDMLFRLLSDNGKNLYMVGDVKQSIYGFRQARPQLFLSRYRDYPDYTDGACKSRILLNANFRSRTGVTDAANFICRQIITPEVCGLDYTGEQLHPQAVFAPADESATLLLTQGSGERPTAEWEARSVADYVVQLLQTRHIAKSKNPADGMRPLEPKDICILLRSRTHAAVFQQALQQVGVSAATDVRRHFIDTVPVTVVLSLLRTVNDPTNDIALTATLLSPLFGFSPDDVTLLRRTFGQPELYAALHQAAEDAANPRLQHMCADFLARLSGWRRLAQTQSAYQLLEHLYDECSLPAVLGGQDEQARISLQQLLDHMHAFDAGGFKGLSAYLRRLDRAGANAPACPSQGQASQVLITVIHQSKGLEYPVVILADTGCLIRRDDIKKTLLLHPEQGMALAPVCPQVGAVNRNEGYHLVQSALEKDLIAEEIRLLYVALTRAREHLCISFACRDLSAALAGCADLLDKNEQMSADVLLQANSPASFLLAALLRHPQLNDLCPQAPTLPAQGSWHIIRRQDPPAPQPLQQAPDGEQTYEVDSEMMQALQQSAGWRYRYAALSALPAKCAVSQLSEKLRGGTDIPDFVCPDFTQTKALTGAERGTAHHTFMQFADLTAADADIEGEIARLTARGLLSARQAAALDRANLRRFFDSELFARIGRADFYHREVPFTFALPASEYPDADADIEAGESVVVQGIADAVFAEDGALILLDFKTDRGQSEQQLRAHYAPQLQLYARALTQIYQMPVRQALLFSLELGKTVAIPL